MRGREGERESVRGLQCQSSANINPRPPLPTHTPSILAPPSPTAASAPPPQSQPARARIRANGCEPLRAHPWPPPLPQRQLDPLIHVPARARAAPHAPQGHLPPRYKAGEYSNRKYVGDGSRLEAGGLWLVPRHLLETTLHRVHLDPLVSRARVSSDGWLLRPGDGELSLETPPRAHAARAASPRHELAGSLAVGLLCAHHSPHYSSPSYRTSGVPGASSSRLRAYTRSSLVRMSWTRSIGSIKCSAPRRQTYSPNSSATAPRT